LIAARPLFASVSTATLANAVGRSANVLLPLALVSIYGANPDTDRFFFILALAFYFYGTLSYAAAEGSVPIAIQYHRSLSSQGIIKIAISATAILLLIAWVVLSQNEAYQIWYAVGFALMAGAGIANGFSIGILHAHSRYALPGLSWALRFIPLILFIASHQPVANLHLLAIGIGVADWCRLALLLCMRPETPASHQSWQVLPFLRRHLSDYLPLSIAMLLMGLNPIVDRLIASLSGTGSLSILDAGERLFGIFSTLCTLGMMTVLLTRLSQAVLDRTLDRKWPLILKMALGWSGIWLLIGAMVGFGIFGDWISDSTSLSEFQGQSVQRTYGYYLPGLLPFTFSIVYIKRLQAIGHNWRLAVISLCMVVFNVPVSLALHSAMGVPGIALATSLVYSAQSLMLAAVVHLKKPHSSMQR